MKTTLAFLLAVLVSLSILCPSCQKQKDYSPQINSLQASLISLQRRCDSLATALNTTNSNLQTTNTNVSNLSNSIESIQVQVASIVSQIATLNSQLTSANANVTVITGKIADLNNQLNSLLLQLNSLLGQQTVINSLQASLIKLQTRYDSLATAIVVINRNLNTTNNTVINLATSITAVQSQITTIVSQITTLNSQITSSNINVNNILSQISVLNNQYNILLTQLNYLISLQTPVTDLDGNSYHTVIIGTQVWMVENLKTTKYNDGTIIPNVTDNVQWGGLTSGAYCWSNNDVSNKAIYGGLYNWYAVGTGKLCPLGWHVPTDTEWTTLTTYLGGESVAGGKMKETGTIHWVSPNTGATNSSGFTGLPGGYRNIAGSISLGDHAYWWSSTLAVTVSPEYWFRYLDNSTSVAYSHSNAVSYGFSIRCIKD